MNYKQSLQLILILSLSSVGWSQDTADMQYILDILNQQEVNKTTNEKCISTYQDLKESLRSNYTNNVQRMLDIFYPPNKSPSHVVFVRYCIRDDFTLNPVTNKYTDDECELESANYEFQWLSNTVPLLIDSDVFMANTFNFASLLSMNLSLTIDPFCNDTEALTSLETLTVWLKSYAQGEEDTIKSYSIGISDDNDEDEGYLGIFEINGTRITFVESRLFASGRKLVIGLWLGTTSITVALILHIGRVSPRTANALNNVLLELTEIVDKIIGLPQKALQFVRQGVANNGKKPNRRRSSALQELELDKYENLSQKKVSFCFEEGITEMCEAVNKHRRKSTDFNDEDVIHNTGAETNSTTDANNTCANLCTTENNMSTNLTMTDTNDTTDANTTDTGVTLSATDDTSVDPATSDEKNMGLNLITTDINDTGANHSATDETARDTCGINVSDTKSDENGNASNESNKSFVAINLDVEKGAAAAESDSMTDRSSRSLSLSSTIALLTLKEKAQKQKLNHAFVHFAKSIQNTSSISTLILLGFLAYDVYIYSRFARRLSYDWLILFPFPAWLIIIVLINLMAFIITESILCYREIHQNIQPYKCYILVKITYDLFIAMSATTVPLFAFFHLFWLGLSIVIFSTRLLSSATFYLPLAIFGLWILSVVTGILKQWQKLKFNPSGRLSKPKALVNLIGQFFYTLTPILFIPFWVLLLATLHFFSDFLNEVVDLEQQSFIVVLGTLLVITITVRKISKHCQPRIHDDDDDDDDDDYK